MFSKLPQSFTAPFELGDGAKLAFRSQPGGISKLATTRVRSIKYSQILILTELLAHIRDRLVLGPSENLPLQYPFLLTFLDHLKYIVLFDTPSDVFSLITPNDSMELTTRSSVPTLTAVCIVRRGLLEAPENIATLIRVTTSRLFNLVSDHTFPSPVHASVVAYASSFIRNSTGSVERSTTKEVLNCIRILQRVLPVVFEADGESNMFEMEVLWKTEEVEEDSEQGAKDEPQFVIEDEDGSDDETEGSSKPVQNQGPKHKKRLPSLGERLFECIIDLLFCCGFTLQTKIQVDHHKINYVIW